MCVSVCLCARAIAFELNDPWSSYSASWFIFDPAKSSSNVEVRGQSHCHRMNKFSFLCRRQPHSVGEDRHVFRLSSCPFRPSSQVSIPWYLMNDLNNFDIHCNWQTIFVSLLLMTWLDSRGQKSKVKVTAGRWVRIFWTPVAIAFELNDLWPSYSASWFILTLLGQVRMSRWEVNTVVAWRSGSIVGLDQRSWPTPSPVSTGMGDRVRVRLPKAALYFGM